MNYQKIESNGYDIHIINNKKFHTINCRICFTENSSKKLITYRNLLMNVLTYATKKYDTKAKFIKECQELYSLSPVASTVRNGKLQTTKFSISTINSSYIDFNNLINNILLLKEIVLNPLVTDNKFSSKYFNVIKKELETESRTLPEEPRLYANIELLKLIDKEELLSTGYCDLKILKEIDEKKLYQSYIEMISNSKIDIFISGNIKDTKKVIQVIKNNFTFKTNCKLNDPQIIYNDKLSKPIIKKEIKKYQQSKLSVGYKLYDLTDFENRYVSFVFDNMLGGGANSLLMKYVREEKSLCYYINSYSNRMDNILIINSGIKKENYAVIIESIDKIITDIKNGKFTLKALNEAKMEVLYNLSNVFESNHNIIEYYYGQSVFNSTDINTKMKMIKKISKEDIISYANKLNIEGIFFLEGDL